MLYLYREVPTMPFSEADIRDRARALWEQAGRPEGQDFGIWIEAERQLAAHDQQLEVASASEQATIDIAPAEAAPAVDQAEVSAQPLPDEDLADEETPDAPVYALDLSYLQFGTDDSPDDQPYH
jgi:Protein of unknown function (DUF2934)